MKIGIFLGYNHYVTLKAEGLGRLLGNLCKGFNSAGQRITCA